PLDYLLKSKYKHKKFAHQLSQSQSSQESMSDQESQPVLIIIIIIIIIYKTQTPLEKLLPSTRRLQQGNESGKERY
uniref:hypothetical protein n=1 Tax=Klebsiella pneumoniae TaxID=573 RepID=UPI003EBD982E